MTSGPVRGALAGAAGVAALNAATYLDMAVRGRQSSDSAEQLVKQAAEKAKVTIPGDDAKRRNRLQGLGPLSGIAVGIGVGAAAGLLHQVMARSGHPLPAAVEAPLFGAAAMALADVPLALMGISDPSSWSAKDWASDIVPHLVYGAITSCGLRTGEA
ncbi:MAG TPA: hypothetical protein VMG38_26660 [Trebonia sp.]|nr:hypothetical protein [Trebonia sp.]